MQTKSWQRQWLGVTLACAALGACMAKDGVVGEIDGMAGAGTQAEPALNGSKQFSLYEFRHYPPEEGRCLPTRLPLVDGDVNCHVYGAQPRAGECCTGPLRHPASASLVSAVHDDLRSSDFCDSEGRPACADYCVCEVAKAVDDDHVACLDPYTGDGDGWCYVAPDQGLGSSDAVRDCPADAKQMVNLAGNAQPQADEIMFLACIDDRAAVEAGALGAVCVPSDELRPDFSGFHPSEVTVSEQASCESGICLVAHFQGRVSCPYGQGQGGSECFLPGSDANVTVEVPPQLERRPPSLASVCSCRCAGPGDGPFCECAADQECAALVADLGLPGSEAFAGSYCVPRDSLSDWQSATGGAVCRADTASCGPSRPY